MSYDGCVHPKRNTEDRFCPQCEEMIRRDDWSRTPELQIVPVTEERKKPTPPLPPLSDDEMERIIDDVLHRRPNKPTKPTIN